jgi:hypothetical protein
VPGNVCSTCLERFCWRCVVGLQLFESACSGPPKLQAWSAGLCGHISPTKCHGIRPKSPPRKVTQRFGARHSAFWVRNQGRHEKPRKTTKKHGASCMTPFVWGFVGISNAKWIHRSSGGSCLCWCSHGCCLGVHPTIFMIIKACHMEGDATQMATVIVK